jgi:ATP synthase protein I
MNDTDRLPLIDTGAKAIFSALALWAAAISLFFLYTQGELAAQSALFGTFIVFFNVWLTQRKLRIAILLSQNSPEQAVGTIYLAAVQRFAFTLLFFIIGMGWMKLMPIPMLIAFAVAQFSYFFTGRDVEIIPPVQSVSDSKLIKH